MRMKRHAPQNPVCDLESVHTHLILSLNYTCRVFSYAFEIHSVLLAWHVTTSVTTSPRCLQLNQSQAGVSGLVEVLSGRRRLLALGELAGIESGYRQALELKHSYPQVFGSTAL